MATILSIAVTSRVADTPKRPGVDPDEETAGYHKGDECQSLAALYAESAVVRSRNAQPLCGGICISPASQRVTQEISINSHRLYQLECLHFNNRIHFCRHTEFSIFLPRGLDCCPLLVVPCTATPPLTAVAPSQLRNKPHQRDTTDLNYFSVISIHFPTLFFFFCSSTLRIFFAKSSRLHATPKNHITQCLDVLLERTPSSPALLGRLSPALA